MARTAVIGFAADAPLLTRLIAAIDGALIAPARIALRNGDLLGFDC